jgi:kelch-like protein 12
LDSADADGVIYAVGGFSDQFQSIHDSVERRDPVSEEWTFVEPMSMPRGNPGAAAVGERIYVVGGERGPHNTTGTGESFDPSTEEWSRIRNRQRGPILGPGATEFDGLVYLVGGEEQGGITDFISIYDPATDKWSHNARRMPTARTLLRAVTLDGQIYAVGGLVGNGQPSFSNALERYDPIADTWTSLRPMSVARGNPGVVAANGRIIVVGGAGGIFGSSVVGLDSVEEYDPAADSWTPSPPPLPVGRGSLSAERGQGNVILAIGGGLTGGVALARVESRLI